MRRRLGALLAVGVVPWLVTLRPGTFDLVFAWGLFSARTGAFVGLHDYLFVHTFGPASLPTHLLTWPLGTLLYLFALASASLSFVDREDRRVTALLLVLAAATSLRMWWGLPSGGPSTVPLGAALLLSIVWWFHAGDLRGLAPATSAEP
jgi:uncharacterized protein (TIGR04206 family)